MDYTVHGILQARILEWVAFPFSRGSSQPRDWPQASCIAGGFSGLSHQGSPRIVEWVVYPFSRGSSQPRNWTGVSCITGRFFTNWAIREAHNKLRREHKITGPDTLLREDLCHILDSTYKWYHMVFVFVWLISFSMIISRPIHVLANGITSFFYGWVLYIYTPHLIYSFICQWTFRLFPCHGCCKSCPYWQTGLHETF